MIKQFWAYLSSIGIKEEYHEGLRTRVTLINQFSFLSIIIYFSSILNNYFISDTRALVIDVIIVVFFLFIIFLNKKGFQQTATFLIISIVSLSVFYFDSYQGIASGNYLYHFPLILAIAFAFDFKTEKKQIIFYYSLIITLLIVNICTDFSLFENKTITAEDKYRLFVTNLILSVFAVAFFIYLTIKNQFKIQTLHEQRILEKEASEKIIKKALEEKDVLMTELHHRVKNNLAVIAGLFSLKLDSIENEEARNVLMESRNRVRSMALIHNRLYKSSNFADVNFEKYVNDLISEIKLSYPTISNAIAINLNIDNITLNVNVAIPCGLILNELITNCYKHAFAGRMSGAIHIWFTNSNNHMTLIVRDNGVGLPPDYDQKQSLGLTVIQSLSEQLEGKCKFIYDNGTCFELTFDYQQPTTN